MLSFIASGIIALGIVGLAGWLILVLVGAAR